MFGMDGLAEIFDSLLTIFLFKPLACFSTAPAYRIQSILQTQTLIPNLPTPNYKSAFRCLYDIVKQEGVESLWKGTSASLWKILPEAYLTWFFRTGYEDAELFPSFNQYTDYKKFCAENIAMGGAVGATTQLFLYPLDLIRLRLATDVVKSGTDIRRFLGIKNCFDKLTNKDGIWGVYEGCSVSIFANVLYRGLFFGIYDSGKPFLPKIEEYDWKNREEYNKKRLWLAMASSLVAHFVVYPIDTIRKRMAMQTGGDKVIYQSAFDCARKCIKTEGLRSLYRGSMFKLGNCAFGGWFLYVMDYRNPIDALEKKFVWL